MASWNSLPLEITSHVFGWTAFISWSSSFYPQVFLNYRRKSVVGLNFNFVLLNLTKHSSYLIYNATLYFSKAVQQQYLEKYGLGQHDGYDCSDVQQFRKEFVNVCANGLSHAKGLDRIHVKWLQTFILLLCISIRNISYARKLICDMIPVAANDVAFSIHAVLLTAFILFQIAIYERGGQKVSRISVAIVSVVWLSAAVCLFIALPSHSWLWLITVFNTMQVTMTVIKYIPQAYMNFSRKSTIGFSTGYILLDLCGGLANYAQMVVLSIDQNSWVNFYGNAGKLLLSLVSITFDLLFICQHYVLYPAKKLDQTPEVIGKGMEEPFIKSPDHPAGPEIV